MTKFRNVCFKVLLLMYFERVKFTLPFLDIVQNLNVTRQFSFM